MKRGIGCSALVAVCVTCGLSTPAAAGDEAPNEPKLVVKERTVKMGRLTEGQRATARFVIENVGVAPLFIDRVTASCGCTVPRKLTEDEKRVDPGESLEIVAEFNSKRRRGKQRKSVSVYSNDPFEPLLQLFVEAEVVTLLDVQVKDRPARRFSFGSVRPGTPIDKTVDILPTEPGRTFEPSSLEIRHTALTFTTESMRKDDRNGVRVRFRVDPDAQIGQIVTSLRIAGKVGGVEVDTGLAINGEVTGLLDYSPVSLKQLQPVLPGNGLRAVKVSTDGSEPFEILSVESGRQILTEVHRDDGRSYSIEVRIADSAPVGPFGTFLDIHTSLVKQPLIRIPVFSSVRPRVEVTPAAVLLRIEGGRRSDRMVKLEALVPGALELVDVVADGPYVRATVIESPGRKSESVRHVEIAAVGDPPEGTHTSLVRISTNIADQPILTIPVRLIVR